MAIPTFASVAKTLAIFSEVHLQRMRSQGIPSLPTLPSFAATEYGPIDIFLPHGIESIVESNFRLKYFSVKLRVNR